MKPISIFIFFCFILSSCKKEGTSSDKNYLIFGHFYGECAGERCIEIFRLEDARLLEDKSDSYPNAGNFYKGSYHPLATSKFNEVRDLLSHFPHDLLREANPVIGQPDAGDWGGLYIEYNFNGVRKFWLLDQMKGNVPQKYYGFIDKVNEKIALLH